MTTWAEQEQNAEREMQQARAIRDKMRAKGVDVVQVTMHPSLHRPRNVQQHVVDRHKFTRAMQV